MHDIPTIPTDGLAYAAVLLINLQSAVRSCEQPKIARVRAGLSWNVASSITNPDAVPFYGNILDARVQIRPGIPTIDPSIQAIGGSRQNLYMCPGKAISGLFSTRSCRDWRKSRPSHLDTPGTTEALPGSFSAPRTGQTTDAYCDLSKYMVTYF